MRLLPNGSDSPDRRLGAEVAELEYLDVDGVGVSVTLNLDQHGRLFEIDSWKYDFSVRKSIPSSF